MNALNVIFLTMVVKEIVKQKWLSKELRKRKKKRKKIKLKNKLLKPSYAVNVSQLVNLLGRPIVKNMVQST